MAEPLITSPVFRANPNAWVSRMCDRLLAPNVTLTERDKIRVARYRERFGPAAKHAAGPHAYEHLCRIARVAGLFAKRRKIPAPVKRAASPPAVPERFRVGAPMPEPPLLRRPFVMLGEAPETWDPSGMPGPC